MDDSARGAFVEALVRAGPWGLAAVCALEPSVLPLSPDLVLSSLILGSLEGGLVWALALGGIASAACFAGSMAAYGLGRWGGHWILGRLLSPQGLRRVESVQERYGAWALFVAAVAPLPYKWFTLAAGAFGTSFPAFCLACGAGRTLRFLALASLVYLVGDSAGLYLRGAAYVVGAAALVAVGVLLVRRRLGGRRPEANVGDTDDAGEPG